MSPGGSTESSNVLLLSSELDIQRGWVGMGREGVHVRGVMVLVRYTRDLKIASLVVTK